MKTHRGAAKRFKKTGTGKIVRARQNKQHILTKKSPKRKRHLRKDALVAQAGCRLLRTASNASPTPRSSAVSDSGTGTMAAAAAQLSSAAL